ncbi:PAS/PAC sensor signal transduction histidine kinase [Hymenobacter gelipurpurascens]|uniref:histidine kinase n=1 Tax=Hymenobacter gelipurpurascens TaxID=89968 RepID=A0A212UHD5_9BACT|nr:ATP-binding protein [Hymenobacter gelipurpurascens]SNC77571.1 PAS/PAC sensor signal transduction histidine kinase [Hymenobacter gelipurpurascens]
MSIKTKITLGLLAMLALVSVLGGYAFYTVQRLDRGSRNILQDNFYSVELGQNMLQALDRVEAAPAQLDVFRRHLTREAGNITEPGEREVVDSLTQNLAVYQGLLDAGAPVVERQAALSLLRDQTHRMVKLNTNALARKNEQANQSAERVERYLFSFIVLSLLLGLMLLLSVPEAAVGPVRKLQSSLQHAADHDFRATIPLESHDEFGQLGRVFNRMLVQLQEYRRSTLAELLTERNRVASIVSGLDEGLLLLDENRRVLLANPVACELLGLPAERLVGRPAAEVALENDLLREILTPLDVDAARREQAVADAPLLRIAQQGEEAFYRLAVQELVSYNEARDKMEFVGQILTLRNVSDFKKLDQVKSNFLATVSHELKTPLSSIHLNAKLLQDERLPAEERGRVAGFIRQETQRLQRMVAELLDVSRLDAGAGIQLDLRATSLADVVTYAAATVQAQLDDKQLRLHVQLPADLPLARADVEKTTWVLINLLSNAIRYSPAGEALTVRAQAADQSVRVSVQDRGPGIAAVHHDKIFQRFAQIPDKAGYRGGSGLGLSIAREFINAQGGRLWVESELGSGSTFHFTLPVASVPAN